MNYRIYKEGRPRKTRIVHFNLLKPYNEERTGEASGRTKRPTPFRSQDFFNKFPDDQAEEDDDDGEVIRNTESTLHERQQRRRNIAEAQVRSRDERSYEPSVPLVEAEQVSIPCNVVEIVEVLADTNIGHASDLTKANQSNEESPTAVRNDQELDLEEQPVTQANETPEMLEETPLARRRPRRDIKPVIRLGIDE